MAVLGLLGAAGVGYATAQNPSASEGAVAIRVLIIVTLVAAGLYAQTSRLQTRMGRPLAYAGLFSVLWLLNGSSNPGLFTIGTMFAAAAQGVFAYLMLAHPAGRLESRTARRFLWWTAVPMTTLWILALEAIGQPPLAGPLVRCLPHCPADPIALGTRSSPGTVVHVALALLWVALAGGTAILLLQRMRTATPLARPALLPVWILSTISAVLTPIYVIAHAVGGPAAHAVGTVDVAIAAALPLAILLGLAAERLFVGQALAELVSNLSVQPNADPQALMASALHDTSLAIAYPGAGDSSYVDATGEVAELGAGRAVTRVERDGRPVALVTYDPELEDQDRYVNAAAVATLLQLEKAQLSAKLKASTSELEASRLRLVETAVEERRRIERDLHDGAQQQLVGLRMKLDLAAEELEQDPSGGRSTLDWIGQQIDEVLAELRSLARGIYPSLLHDRGLVDSLGSVARIGPNPVSVQATGIGRYSESIETAVYYCCREALQNVSKHAGPGARAWVRLWRANRCLDFEVRDDGVGFDASRAASGAGLTNMDDRIDAVGGTLELTSSPGAGTTVHGRIPVG